MKTIIIETRRLGVLLERGQFRQQLGVKGELEIIDTRENSFNRILKLAHLKNEHGRTVKTLYNVAIVFIAEDRMGLTGFERVQRDDEIVDFAQSWVCRIQSQEAGRDNENVMPKKEHFRH